MPADCPNHDQLRTWLDDDSVELSNHIDTCAVCQQSVQTMLEDCDEFLHSFREVAIHAANPSQQRAVDAIKAKVVQRLSTDKSAGVQQSNSDEWIGRTLGQYEIQELVGKGGMGRVYRARHFHLQKDVAIKLLLASRASHGQAAERFTREWVASAKVTSPHVVQALDAGKVDDVAFLVLEFLEGLNLRKLRQATSQLSVPIACELVRQATVGLKAIDEAGLVHRDIKPSNLMLTSDGVVKLLDLGLARFNETESPGDGELTVSGVVLGTMQFMAPEQCRKPGEADVRADLYSLGCTLYYLLTGQPPFHGSSYESIYDVMRGHVKDEVPLIATYRNDVPDDVIAIVAKLLAKAPEDRFATPSELIDALSPFATEANLQSLAMTAVRDNEATRETEPNRLGSTVSYSSSQPATSAALELPSSIIRLAKRPKGRVIIALSMLLLVSVVFFQSTTGKQVIRIATNKGQLVIEGAAPNVRVIIQQNDIVIQQGNRRQYNLRVGEYDLALTEPDGTQLHTESFQITRGGRSIVRARYESVLSDGLSIQAVERDQPTAVDVQVPELHPLAAEQLDNNFGPASIVPKPAKIVGVERWTIETLLPRGEVRQYDFSPSGEFIAIGGSDGTIRVYDEKTLELKMMLPGLRSISAICWSPDSAYLAAGDDAGQLLVWDVSSGLTVLRSEFTGMNNSGVASIAWSPDGRSLAAGVPGEVVVAIDLTSQQKQPVVLDGIRDAIISWSHDGTRLAMGGGYGKLAIRDVESGTLLLRSDTNGESVTSVVWSPDDRLVATSHGPRGTQVWDLQGQSIAQLHGDFVTWSTVGDRVVTSDGKQVMLWNAATWEVERTFADQKGTWKIKRPALSRDGKQLLYTRHGESDFCLVNLEEMRFRYSPSGYRGGQAIVDWSPAGNAIASSHLNSNEVVLFVPNNSPTVEVRPVLDNGNQLFVRCLAWSPDGTELAFGGSGTVGIVRYQPEHLRVLQDERVSKTILAIDWSKSGIATRSADGQVDIWNPGTGNSVRRFSTTEVTVGSVHWSPDANKCAFGSLGGIFVWDPSTDNVTTLATRDSHMPALAWAPDSKSIAFAFHGNVLVKDTKSGITREFRRDQSESHDDWIWSICWSPDGETLITHGGSRVRIWDAGDGSLQREIEASPTNWLCNPTDISPEGRTLAVCGPDRTVRLWSVESGEPLLSYSSLDSNNWLVVGPDGNWLSSEGLEEKLVYLVETSTGVARLTANDMRSRYGWQPDIAAVKECVDRIVPQ